MKPRARRTDYRTGRGQRAIKRAGAAEVSPHCASDASTVDQSASPLRGCAFALAGVGLTACCGNGRIPGLLKMGENMGKNCCGGNYCLGSTAGGGTLRNAAAAYLAGVLFPEGAVAGGRRPPLSFHSITSSARASSVGGTSRPSTRAVLELTNSSSLVAWWTGSSAGLAPARIRPV